MALHFSAEVVLANLTMADVNNMGVSFNDINIYCQKVREKLKESGITRDEELTYNYFEVDKFSVENAIMKYSGQFYLFKNKIYKRDEIINLDLFNSRYKPIIIKDILILSADETIKLAKENQDFFARTLNSDKLEQIKELAVYMHNDQESLLFEDKPFVRKLELK